MSDRSRDPIRISSVSQIVDVVKQAAQDGHTISVSRSAGSVSPSTGGDTVRLDLSGLSAVVDYPARDMTITVQAGLTVGQLLDIAAAEQQQLPVDIADPGMTVGAFVAADQSGSRRYGCGTLRDYLIGMEAVDGQGRVFHAGGRVVKNVAGYDLCRLAVGSRGRIGILTQLTFRLNPVPPHAAVLAWSLQNHQAAADALERLNLSAARPVILDLKAGPDGWMLFVGIEGAPEVCDWQQGRLEEELAGTAAGSSHPVAASFAESVAWCRQVLAGTEPSESRSLWTIRTLPSTAAECCDRIVSEGGICHCHAGDGVVRAQVPHDINRNGLKTELRRWLDDHGGHLLDAADRTGSGRDDSWSARVARAFDPSGLFV